jgi:hypothetical protein
MGGKRETLGWLNAIAPGILVHVVDQISSWRFLVDTGAAFSIIPHFPVFLLLTEANWPNYQVLGGEGGAAEAVGSVV